MQQLHITLDPAQPDIGQRLLSASAIINNPLCTGLSRSFPRGGPTPRIPFLDTTNDSESPIIDRLDNPFPKHNVP